MTPADTNPNQLDDSVISAQLLAALRDRTGDANLDFAEPPAKLTGGFETITYKFRLNAAPDQLSGPLVLRLFSSAGSVQQSRRESAFQNVLAGLGYPVPEVLAQFDTGIAGRPFNIMTLAEGHQMMAEISQDEAGIKKGAEWLARVHTRLHQVPSGPVIEAVEQAGFPREQFMTDGRINFLRRYFEDETLAALKPGFDWLLANRPGERETPVICHGDFHPMNVLVKDGHVTGVIDWPGAAFADPEYDVAVSLVLIKVAAGQMEPQLHQALAVFADIYLQVYAAAAPLDLEKVRYYEAMRCFRAFLRGTALRAKGVNPDLRPRDGYPWASDLGMQLASKRLLEITGIEFPLL